MSQVERVEKNLILTSSFVTEIDPLDSIYKVVSEIFCNESLVCNSR